MNFHTFRIRFLHAGVLLFALLLLLLPRQEAQAASKGSIYLKEKKVTMIQCEHHRLKLKGAVSSAVKWSSSDLSVAEVSSTGRVHALKSGRCRITATYKKKKYVCKVTVRELALSETSVCLVRGRQVKLSFNSRYASKASWKSTNPKVASVDETGRVQAITSGSCEIQGRWRGVTLSCALEVLSTSKDNLEKSYSADEKNYGKIVLAGSSSLDLWNSSPQAFEPYEIINMAMGGTRTTQWLGWYESLIVRYRPSAVVVYVGANDLNSARTVGELNMSNTISLLKKLKRDLGDVPIFYVGICPCYCRKGAWSVIRTSNTMVQQYCSLTKNVYYLDLPSAVCLADGTPNPEYFLSDLLHPNAKGYEIWKQVVAGAVKKELDKRAEAAEDAVS